MKPTPLPLLIALLLAAAPIGSAQESQPVPPRPIPSAGRASPPQTELTKFDLDFKGGTPKELVAAISQAMGRSLNAIVPDDVSQTRLPALNLTGVTVKQIFDALQIATQRYVEFQRPGRVVATAQAYSFFVTQDGASDHAIWCFRVEDPSLLNPVSEYREPAQSAIYQLGPYLGHYKVEDITTAVETAWKMMGVKTFPEMKFHKDTQLLIAVGAQEQLDTVTAVLGALDRGTATKGAKPSTAPDILTPKADKP